MLWLRFSRDGGKGFGILEGDQVRVCRGDMFSAWQATGEVVPAGALAFDTPCSPTKMIALWNNFHEAAKKFSLDIPAQPLYFLKAANSFCAHGASVPLPRSYSGRILFEGELGVVIGREGRDIAPEEAAGHVFGYTCVNDVTAIELLKADPSFPQWTRAKSFDGFCPFGPVIATGLDPAELAVKVLVNGRERQSYPARDMIFPPEQLVSLLSRDMTLVPGDVICCGTSVGAGPIPKGASVDVVIDGIGILSNRFE